jgi:hypothetical protein
MRSICALLFLAAVAAPAAADGEVADSDVPVRSVWTFDLGTTVRRFASTSAASLSEAPLFGPRVTAARKLATFAVPRNGIVLRAFARVGGGQSDGELFQSLTTHIGQLAVTGGGRAEVDLWHGLSASAELELGAARTSVVIGDDLGAMAPVDDSAWHAIGSTWLGLGYSGQVRGGRFSIALFIEAGYTVTQAVAIHATPRTRPEPELSIPTVYAALGDLDTGGLSLASSFRLGF